MKQPIRNNVKENNGITEETPIYTLLFDMNSIMKMSMVDKRTSSKGLEYGMIFQTLIQMKILLAKKTWDYVYAMYDGDDSGYLRYEIYKDYKANRDKNYEMHGKSEYDRFLETYAKKVINYSKEKRNASRSDLNAKKRNSEKEDEEFERQREIIFKILEELFVRQIICDDVEGDDLIAYYCKNKKKNEKIVIVSSDRDLTQLIRDDISVYIPKIKKFITPKNDVELLGCPSYNIVLKKQICGDSSDNIKGIKGVGEDTLLKYFPDILKRKMDIDEIISESKKINEERTSKKLKPLKSISNITESVTDGIQGHDIYEINKKIIDLSAPMLTKDAEEELNDMMYAEMDSEGRSFENVYRIICDNGFDELNDENKFASFFAAFNPIADKEKKRFKEKKD